MDSSGGATLLDSGISAVIGKIQSVFISGQLNVMNSCYSAIPLFRYFIFRVLPTPFPSGAIGEEWSEPRWLIVCACIVPETSALCIILNAKGRRKTEQAWE